MTGALAACMALCWAAPAPAQSTCDALAARLFKKPIEQALQRLDCSILGKVGLNHGDHRLTGICYAPTGSSSRLELDASLTCKTSDAALIKASVSERVHATATVTAADCRISALDISSPGDLGKALLQHFDVKGLAFKALQTQLDAACAP